VGELVVKRWTRYGKDRLYVNDAADGSQVGWLDLQTDEVALEREELREAFEIAIASHRGEPTTQSEAAPQPPPPPPSVVTAAPASGTPPPAGTVPPPPPRAVSPVAESTAPRPEPTAAAPPARQHEDFAVTIDWRDLSRQDAGAAAQQQARAEHEAAPVRTFAARILGVHTDERAWRVGAKGELLVAARLEKLPEPWCVLHAVPVGDRGSDIDHVVIGPGGVFTVNAKCHPDANVWVGGNTFMVNGHRQPYVRNSRHEAKRAARLLSTALGWPVTATGVIAVVGARSGYTVKAQPDDVYVVTRKQIARWLRSLPQTLGEEQIQAIYAAGRRSDTWRT
jgi:hypothetical protein